MIFQCYVWLPEGNHCLFFALLAAASASEDPRRSAGTVFQGKKSWKHHPTFLAINTYYTHTHIYIYNIYIIYNVCIISNPKPSQTLWWIWHIKKAFYQVTYLINKHQSHVRNHQAVPSHGVSLRLKLATTQSLLLNAASSLCFSDLPIFPLNMGIAIEVGTKHLPFNQSTWW